MIYPKPGLTFHPNATPKPRAGEHVQSRLAEFGTMTDAAVLETLIAERDLLRERERELVKALRQLLADCDADLKPMGLHPARTLLRAFYPDGR